MKSFRSQYDIYIDTLMAMDAQHPVGYSGLNPSIMPNGQEQTMVEFSEYMGKIAAAKISGEKENALALKDKIIAMAKNALRSAHHTDEEMFCLLTFALDLDELV